MRYSIIIIIVIIYIVVRRKKKRIYGNGKSTIPVRLSPRNIPLAVYCDSDYGNWMFKKKHSGKFFTVFLLSFS